MARSSPQLIAAPGPQPTGKQNLSALLGIVADPLRGDYKQSDYGKGSSGQPWSRPTPDLEIPCGIQDAQGAGGGFSELPKVILPFTVLRRPANFIVVGHCADLRDQGQRE